MLRFCSRSSTCSTVTARGSVRADAQAMPHSAPPDLNAQRHISTVPWQVSMMMGWSTPSRITRVTHHEAYLCSMNPKFLTRKPSTHSFSLTEKRWLNEPLISALAATDSSSSFKPKLQRALHDKVDRQLPLHRPCHCRGSNKSCDAVVDPARINQEAA